MADPVARTGTHDDGQSPRALGNGHPWQVPPDRAVRLGTRTELPLQRVPVGGASRLGDDASPVAWVRQRLAPCLRARHGVRPRHYRQWFTHATYRQQMCSQGLGTDAKPSSHLACCPVAHRSARCSYLVLYAGVSESYLLSFAPLLKSR